MLTTDPSGRFIVGEDSVPMQLWQHVDLNGKLHYSLVPALEDTKTPQENSKNTSEYSKNPKIAVKIGSVERRDSRNRYADTLVHFYKVAVDSYTCDKCGMKFPMENMLNRHKMSHNLNSWLRRKRLSDRTSERPLKVASRRKSRMLSQKLLEKQQYSCASCDFNCNKRSTLTVHIRKNHRLDNFNVQGNSRGRNSQRTLCIVCNRKCESQAALSKHMIKEHKDRKASHFKCNSCSFTCSRSSTLLSHVRRYHQSSSKEEAFAKKKSKASKCSEAEEFPKEETLQKILLHEKDQDKRDSFDIDASVISSLPSESEYKIESSVTTRAGRKQNKKPVEEQCNLCDFKCSKKSTLYSHKRQHKIVDISEVYTCNECSFKTNKKSSLYSHIKRKHKEPKLCTPDGQPQLFYCNQCDYKNKNKYELKVHVARKHTDDFKFSCETCGKKFKVKGDLTNHIRFSHKEQPVICDVCGKTCLNSNSLYVHQKFAHYKAKYECQVCKRRMVTQENLNEHMIRQHEKRENVVCEECGKTFSRNSRLKVHMRIHTGDKPYTCTICNKSFARRTALKQHLLIHTGIRPYVCDICGKAFTQKPGLISHRKSHPGSHPPLPRVLIDHILNDVMNN